MTPTFIARWRFALVFIAIAFGYCGILGRLYYLQIYKGREIMQMAEHSRERVDVLRARRGSISDANGNLLAATNPVIELGVDPERFRKEDEAKLPELSRLVNVPVDQLKELCAPSTYPGKAPGEVCKVRWRKIADAISDHDYDRVRALKIPSLYGNRKYIRNYPNGISASHLIGYVNKQEAAVMGVESQFDYYLRGQDGWREVEADARRHEMVQFEKREVPARDGQNIQLTIDLVVQDIIDRQAAALAQQYSPDSVIIIVSDPRTGDILGLANWPTYDPNQYGSYPVEAQRNRAITDVFEPGSTFKIVSVSGAIDQHLVTPNTLVNCGLDSVDYHGRTIALPKDDEPLGVIPISQVVAVSSNRGAAQMGMKLGDENFLSYVYKYGFGQKSDVFGPGEVCGIVHPIKKWDGLTISRMPMGQSVSVTAMQIHFAMSSIANGGILMRPHFVKRVYDGDGNTIFTFNDRTRNRVISQQTADTMKTMLEGVAMKGGTAPKAEIKGYEVAGKTGTSQKVEDGHYSHTKHVSTFTGFFPASNPRLAITVVVDNGKRPDGGTCFGGIVAAPAFHDIAQQLIQYMAIEPPAPTKNSMYADGSTKR